MDRVDAPVKSGFDGCVGRSGVLGSGGGDGTVDEVLVRLTSSDRIVFSSTFQCDRYGRLMRGNWS